jgi:hypothetical protein
MLFLSSHRALVTKMIREFISFLSALATVLLKAGQHSLKLAILVGVNCARFNGERRLNHTSLAKEHCSNK